jgi:hypothetical protein
MATWLTSDLWQKYLPPRFHERDDATYLVNKAEREVIQHYSRRRESVRFRVSAVVADLDDGIEHLRDPSRDVIVFLRYYKEDPDNIDTSDPQREKFVNAMRAEVAGVVEHMTETSDQRQGVTSKTQGSKSISYEGGRVETLPPTFGRYLNPFDLRPRNSHI